MVKKLVELIISTRDHPDTADVRDAGKQVLVPKHQ